MIIRTCAYPRAGLVGNPSDGYHGKTISFVFSNYRAEVTLYQSPELEIQPSTRDRSAFRSMRALVEDVNMYGYYGGIRLLKAAIKTFSDHCARNRIVLDDRNYTIRYTSDIPHRVGLAGSSAIITACFRALMAFYQVSIPNHTLANLVLSVERDELGIAAGLQDRVVQAYEGLVYMDFSSSVMDRQGYGVYEYLDPGRLPPLYIAYRADLSEGSEVLHSDLRERFELNDRDVVEAVRFWAGLTDAFRASIDRGDSAEAARIIDANFDRRRAVCSISAGNVQMIERARAAGASAKFSGSGGAIVGSYGDDTMYNRLVAELEPLGVCVIKPAYVDRSGGAYR
jgi:glucuronokinase